MIASRPTPSGADVLRLETLERQSGLLAAASNLAAEAHDAEELAVGLVDLLVERIGDACVIRLLAADQVTLAPLAVAHRDPQASALLTGLLHENRQRPDSGLGARIFETAKPARLTGLTDEAALRASLPWFEPYVRRYGTASVLYVPLRTLGRVEGILALHRDRGGADYTEGDEAVALQIADRASLAFHALRLDAASRVARLHAAQPQRLYALASALAAALDQRQIGQVVVDEGLKALGARAGSVALLDGEAPEMFLLATRGYPTVAARWARFPLAMPVPLAEAARTGQPVFVPTLDEFERRYGASAELRAARHEALFAAPLVFEGRAIGALGMSFAEARVFLDEDRALVAALCAQCAQALERARLFDVEQRSRARSGYLAESASILSSSLEYRTTLANVARLLVPGLADWCAVDLVEEGTLRLVAVAHVDPAKVKLATELRERFPPRPNDTIGVFEVIRTGAPILLREIPDALLAQTTYDAVHLDLIRGLGLHSAMLVPLATRGRTLGALTLVSTRQDRRYGAADLATAQELARHVAAAVDNARLFSEAQAAVAIRDSFLSIAGHELRTPLTALKLQLQLLERVARSPGGVEPARLEAAATSAARQADRLERLINELLDVSRIAAGKLSLDLEEVDLCALAQEVTARFAEEATRAGCALSLTKCEAVVGRWDRARLDQVATNLLGNALKYGKGKPVEVVVAREGDTAILVVRDRGIGIAQENHARIFGRFERAVSERHYGGLGLGLWIVRQMVDLHRGSIVCKSALGEGSEFTVRLPLRDLR
ncbi:MAG: hypothetical protein NVSMB23_03400 [Myxococcales bacterium]